jgi:uncharacterized membrane protein
MAAEEKVSTAQPISAFTLFTKSKELVLANLTTYGILFILPFLTTMASALHSGKGRFKLTPGLNGFNFSAAQLGYGSIVAIVVAAVYTIVTVMTYVMNLETTAGKKPILDDLWPATRKFFWRILGLTIVTAVVIMLGFIALIVPGLIFIRRYTLAPYVLIDKDLSIGDAMKESARISKPFAGSIWGLIGVMMLISLTGIVPLVGWAISFALTALYTVAPALRYNEIKKLAPTA